MDSFDLLVINGLVVTASDTANYDIAVKDGKIAFLAPPGVLLASSAKKVIDAEGGYVMVRPDMDVCPNRGADAVDSLEESTAMSISRSLRCSEGKGGVRTTLRLVCKLFE